MGVVSVSDDKANALVVSDGCRRRLLRKRKRSSSAKHCRLDRTGSHLGSAKRRLYIAAVSRAFARCALSVMCLSIPLTWRLLKPTGWLAIVELVLSISSSDIRWS
jgi:hypothetical protein